MQRISKLTLAAVAAVTALAFAGASAPVHAQNCGVYSCGGDGGRTQPPVLMGSWGGTMVIGANAPHDMMINNLVVVGVHPAQWQYSGSSSCDHDTCDGTFQLAEQTVLNGNQAGVSFSFPDPDRDLTPGSCMVTSTTGFVTQQQEFSASLAGTFTLGAGCVHAGENGTISLTSPPPTD